MRRLRTVKNLLFSTLIMGTGVGYAAVYPKLECGVYHIKGYLDYSSTSGYVLRLKHKSTSPVEFLLWGGSSKVLFPKKHTQAEVEVFVPRPIENPKQPITLFRGFTRNKITEPEGIKKVRAASCSSGQR